MELRCCEIKSSLATDGKSDILTAAQLGDLLTLSHTLQCVPFMKRFHLIAALDHAALWGPFDL